LQAIRKCPCGLRQLHLSLCQRLLRQCGVSAWDCWDPGELTLYFRPWRGIKKGDSVVLSGYFLLRRDGVVSLGQIACNSSRVLNWSWIVVFSWRNQSTNRCSVVYLKC
jgi:hypothetical protein